MAAWARGQSEPPTPGMEWVDERLWSLGSPGDFVLFGPDAGNWAANARALMEGTTPDLNRLPLFGLLTGLASAWYEVDVVFGGHLVNHIVGVAVGAVAYLLGKELGGRAVGLGAGLLTASSPWLVNASNLYGVDPTFGLATALLFLGTWLGVRGRWWLIPLTGIGIGLVLGTHYLGILFPVPCALALALSRNDWRVRIAAPLVALLLGWGVFEALTWSYPPIGLDQIQSVYATGAASGLDDASLQTTAFSKVLGVVGEAVGSGLALAVQQALIPVRDAGLPWVLGLALFWVGLLGPGLPPGGDKDFRWSWDWRSGLFLAVMLLPLSLLEAVRAPERYRYWAQPLVFIVLLRGAASLAAIADQLILRKWPKDWPTWPSGLLAFALCLPMALPLGAEMRQDQARGAPADQGLQERQLGELSLREFGSGGGIVTNSQVVAFHAERERCQGPAPGQATVQEAITLLRSRCRGRGDLPYIVGTRKSMGFADVTDEQLDAYVEANFEAVGTITGKDTDYTLYRIPR